MKKDLESKEYLRRLGFAREEVAKAWCTKKTEKKEMDTELAGEFAKILVEHIYAPHLGCATTKELIDEITSRIDDLDYKTIDD